MVGTCLLIQVVNQHFIDLITGTGQSALFQKMVFQKDLMIWRHSSLTHNSVCIDYAIATYSSQGNVSLFVLLVLGYLKEKKVWSPIKYASFART